MTGRVPVLQKISILSKSPGHKARLLTKENTARFLGKNVTNSQHSVCVIKTDEALAFLHKPSVKLFQRNLVVDILLGEITAFFFGRQLHHRGLVFGKEEFPIQPLDQPVAILLCGVAQQDDQVGGVAVVADGVLALLCLVCELSKDGRDGIRLEVWRDVAQQNHAAAV